MIDIPSTTHFNDIRHVAMRWHAMAGSMLERVLRHRLAMAALLVTVTFFVTVEIMVPPDPQLPPPLDCSGRPKDTSLYSTLILPPPNSSFSIWTYDFDEEYLRQGTISPSFRKGSFLSDDPGYTWEFLLADVMRDRDGPFGPYIASDPSNATLRLVPFYPTAYFHALLHEHDPDIYKKTDAYVDTVLGRVIGELPYWNHTLGRDHVYIFAHDNGMSLINNGRLRSLLSQGIFVGPLGSYRQHDAFRPNKDVVVSPYDTDDSYRRRAYSGSIPDLRGRKTLCSFMGSVMPDAPEYSNGVRQHVYATHRNIPGFRIYSTDRPDPNESPPQYRDLLDSSIFCLYLAGWSPARWSGRLAHLLNAGCIPVVAIDDLELPFEEFIRWERIAVIVSEKQVLNGKLPDILNAISQDERERMAAGVREIAQILASPYVGNARVERAQVDNKIYKPTNVFHFVIAALYARAKRFGLIEAVA